MKNVWKSLPLLFLLGYQQQILGQWVQLNGPTGGYVRVFGSAGSNLFVGGYGGVDLSTNGGTTWVNRSTGLPANVWIRSFLTIGSTTYAGTSFDGLFTTTNSGTSWSNVAALASKPVNALLSAGGRVYAGTRTAGIYHSTDQGASWQQSNLGLTNLDVNALIAAGTSVIAGTSNGIFVSTDNGGSWVRHGPTSSLYVYSFAVKDTFIFAGTDGNTLRSTDQGNTWNSLTGSPQFASAIVLSGTTLFTCRSAYTSAMYRSDNNGTSWTAVTAGLPFYSDIGVVALHGSTLFAGFDGPGIYRSTDNGSTWIESNTGFIRSQVSRLVVRSSSIHVGTDNSGVFESTDGGTTWTKRGLTGAPISALLHTGTTLIAGTIPETIGNPLHRSTDNGATWTDVASIYSNVSALLLRNTRVYAATSSDIYQSDKSGITWTRMKLPSTAPGASLATRNGVLYVRADATPYMTETNGMHWTRRSNIPGAQFYCLGTSTNSLLAGNATAAYWSSDQGSSWTQSLSKWTYCLVSIGGHVLAGGNGVSLSKDDGHTWTSVSTGLPASGSVKDLKILNGVVYAAVSGGGVWKRPLSEFDADYPPGLLAPADGATGLSSTVTFTWAAAAYGSTYRLRVFNPDGSLVTQRDVAGTAASGVALQANREYMWNVQAILTGYATLTSATWRLATKLDPMALLAPANGASGLGTTVMLDWSSAAPIKFSTAQVSRDSFQTAPQYEWKGILNAVLPVGNLSQATNYFWRVTGYNNDDSATSSIRKFTTGTYSGSFVMDGTKDGTSTVVASSGGRELAIALHGSTLYVSTNSANNQASDVFVFLTRNFSTPRSSPQGKAGTVVGYRCVLMNRLSDNLVVWLDSLGGIIGTGAASAVGAGVVEGTINLSTQMGINPPSSLGIAVGFYPSASGGTMTNQLPIGNGNANIDSAEFLRLMITDISGSDALVPTEMKLEQNFPNPFNPTTTIRYVVAAADLFEHAERHRHVSLRVFDLLGREVAVLVDEEQSPGAYTAIWNASGKASSVYYYQLRTGSRVFTKKMLLLR